MPVFPAAAWRRNPKASVIAVPVLEVHDADELCHTPPARVSLLKLSKTGATSADVPVTSRCVSGGPASVPEGVSARTRTVPACASCHPPAPDPASAQPVHAAKPPEPASFGSSASPYVRPDEPAPEARPPRPP